MVFRLYTAAKALSPKCTRLISTIHTAAVKSIEACASVSGIQLIDNDRFPAGAGRSLFPVSLI